MNNVNCSECLALQILKDNGYIGSDAFISDKQDIRSNTNNVEVTIASSSKIETQACFGDKPLKHEVDMSYFDCPACDCMPECEREGTYEPIVRCRKCSVHKLLRDNGFVIEQGEAIYNHGKHPITLPWSSDYFGNRETIEYVIRTKEEKSKNYKGNNLDLFILYSRCIDNMLPISSNVFKNIYIYCINNGWFYKNWEMVKHYEQPPRIICYNHTCENYMKIDY